MIYCIVMMPFRVALRPATQPAAPKPDTSPAPTATASQEANVQADNNGWAWLVGLVVAVIVLAGGLFLVRRRNVAKD